MSRLIFSSLILSVLASGIAEADPNAPVALRITSMPVTPAHMPGVKVWISNTGEAPYAGSVRVELPEGWKLSPESQSVTLAPSETTAVSFTIHEGKTRKDNRYTMVAVAERAGREVRRKQDVVCASAPYFKPQIDGRLDDWKDAIPVAFDTAGKKTTVSTLWNRRQFSVLVAVEEDELVPLDETGPCDAVQVAISPQNTTTSTSVGGKATRHEFLLTAAGAGQGGRCFRLAEPGTSLGDTQTMRNLVDLEVAEPKLAIWREDTTTYYEWGISFRSLDGIRPSEGREFFLSVLIHDPDGTGIRDWGVAAGLWPSQRNRLAWSLWPGAKWPDEPPMDNKVEWGMCSSKF